MTIAVLIPARNEAADLPDCLRSLPPVGVSQVILADAGSCDGTVALAEAAGARVLQPGRGSRGADLNAAAATTTADILLFVHADTRLPATAGARIRAALADPGVVGGCFSMRLDRAQMPYPWIAALGDCYCRWTGELFGDRAIFVRRGAFAAVGGFHDLPVMEEVELGRRLRRRGRLVFLPGPVISSARQFEAQGPWRLATKAAIATAAFQLGVDPAWIRRFYYRRPAVRSARSADR